MRFDLATHEHLERICEITEQAKRQLRQLGLTQWQKGYPSREIWENDVREQTGYVAIEDGEVLGAFALQVDPEPSYAHIEGSWLTDGSPYLSMHRVCVADGCKGRGIAGQMFAFALQQARMLGLGSLRIDTHPGNLPMQHALEKTGFHRCGSIVLVEGCEKGDPRIAYEQLAGDGD